VSGPGDELAALLDDFEWDEQKSEATRAERGVGFDAAAAIFAGVYLNREDERRQYGEHRFIATGEAGGRVITVVWTPRGGRRRIIAAWPASNRERREYRAYREEISAADPGFEAPN
jgi:uncharacterized DUF497 family protein